MSDTINELLDNKYWYERILIPDSVNNVPEGETLSQGINFEKARKLLVNLPVKDNGKFGGYTNDLIIYAVDINNNLERIIEAPCVVIKSMYH